MGEIGHRWFDSGANRGGGGDLDRVREKKKGGGKGGTTRISAPGDAINSTHLLI